MYCIYVQVVSAVLCEVINSPYLKMNSEVKSLGGDYGNGYRRERYRRSDKRYRAQTNGEKSSRYRSRTRSREGRERVWNTGMPGFDLNFQESGVFLNEELGNDSADLGQIIVVDSGCPRGLLGEEQLKRLKEFVDVEVFNVRAEGFRFGPSKIYRSSKKVRIAMRVGINEIFCDSRKRPYIVRE